MPIQRLAQYAEPVTADSDNRADSLVKRDEDGNVNVGTLFAESGVRSDGHLYLKGTTITATATLGPSHMVVYADATAGAITVNLPAAAGVAGQVYIIKKIDAVNNVTIDGNGSETIDGAATKVLSAQWAYCVIQAKGSVWYVIG